MATKKPAAKSELTDWENETAAQEWESASSGGFAPLWKPEHGESIVFQPNEVHLFKIKKKKKGNKTPSYAISGILKSGSLANFYSGKGTATDVKHGDMVTVGSSYNLCAEDKLIVIEKSGARLSRMSEMLLKDDKAFRIVFNGKVKTEGARSVNDFTVQYPKGYKEKLSKS